MGDHYPFDNEGSEDERAEEEAAWDTFFVIHNEHYLKSILIPETRLAQNPRLIDWSESTQISLRAHPLDVLTLFP